MTKIIDGIYNTIIKKNNKWVYQFKKYKYFKILGNEIPANQEILIPTQLTNKPWNFDENNKMSQYQLESIFLNYLKINNLLKNGYFSTNKNLQKLFDIKPGKYKIKYLSNFIIKLYNLNLNLNYIIFSIENLQKINTLYRKDIYDEVYELIKYSYKISDKINNNSIIDLWKINVMPYLISLLILNIL